MDSKSRCIAQTIASLAPERAVIAPTKSIAPWGVNCSWKGNQIQCTFSDRKISHHSGMRGYCEKIYYFFIPYLSFCHCGLQDVTARFKAVPCAK